MKYTLKKYVHRCRDSTANRPAKNRQNHEKKFKINFISDLPTLIFSQYETGTTDIFLRPNLKKIFFRKKLTDSKC
jgi:hypothetical protein